MAKNEPERLKQGRKFHADIQSDWKREAEGEIGVESGIVKPSGRRGRVDVLVDAGDDLMAVVEIKASDWDSMTEKAVRRNVRRQAKQIWDYIESQLAEGKRVSAGVIFPERPSSKDRLELVEKLFDEQDIPVVWHDETIEEHRARMQQEGD